MAIDEKLKAELSKAHAATGGVAFLELPEGTLAFRCPKAADYERFQDKMARGKGESAAMRELVLCSMIHPNDKMAGSELLKRYVAAIPRIIEVLQQMAGAEVTLELKVG